MHELIELFGKGIAKNIHYCIHYTGTIHTL